MRENLILMRESQLKTWVIRAHYILSRTKKVLRAFLSYRKAKTQPGDNNIQVANIDNHDTAASLLYPAMVNFSTIGQFLI